MSPALIATSAYLAARGLRVAVATCLIAGTLTAVAGCYRLRIDESFWLRPRPGSAADSIPPWVDLPTGYTIRRVAIPVSDTGHLAVVVALRAGAQATVLFFGGDDFVIATQGPATLRALTVAPVNVVLVDYPGSGTSSGRPTLLGIHQAAEAAYEWLVAQPELASPGVVLHGHSIGSFVAAALADVRPVRGLVLQNSATNPVDWMHAFFRPSRLKWWARPAYPFVRISIDSALAHEDNAGRLRRYRGPLLILSGTADDKAPPEMSRDLAAQSATPDSLKRLVVLPNAGHENVFSHPGFAPAYRTFITLVATAQGTPRSPAPANER